MREKTIKCYQYHELGEKAKQKARNWFLGTDEMDWAWDDMRRDAMDVGIKLTSIDERAGAKGELILDFSQVLTMILKDHGDSCETYKTAAKYKKLYDALSEEEIISIDASDVIREDFLREILEDYRVMWSKEVEYHYSDEYVAECMEANKYDFDENGRRI